MTTVKKRVSELTGAALDYAVAKAVGIDMHIVIGHSGEIIYPPDWSPSTDWRRGGPLVEKYKIELAYHDDYSVNGVLTEAWEAVLLDDFVSCVGHDDQIGETALIAICRAVVMAKLGQEIELPAILFGGEA